MPRMLILDRKSPKVAEYIESLFKAQSEISESEKAPRIRCIRTRIPSGRNVVLMAPGPIQEHENDMLQWLVNELDSLKLPVHTQIKDRELNSHDFFLNLDQAQKALIVHFLERESGDPIIECSGKEFKRTQCHSKEGEPGTSYIADVINWLDTQAICPEIHFYNIRSWKYEDAEKRKAMELILNELISG